MLTVGYCLLGLTLARVSSCSGSTICSTWPYLNQSIEECSCGCTIRCTSGMAEISNGVCVTYDAKNDGYYHGSCPFRYKENNTDRLFSVLPTDPDRLNDSLCGPYNRRGLLCGECIEGYGPAVYSFDMKCADCSKLSVGSAIVVYLLLQFIPITLFLIGVIVFRLNITSGPLLGYVLFCQFFVSQIKLHFSSFEFINSHVSAFLSFLLHLDLILSDFWNLNIFRPLIPPFCISEELTRVHVLMLRFVPTIYPVILIIITCYVMDLQTKKVTPLKNKMCVSRDSVFHAFASIIFLSSTTNIHAFSDLLMEVHIFFVTANSSTSLQWNTAYFDPARSNKIQLYVAMALLLCLVLVFLPSLLLCLYLTRIYRSLSRFISARKRLAITAFAEALHSCFKDGLNGTRDYRSLAGASILTTPLFNVFATFEYSMTNGIVGEHIAVIHVCFITSLLLSYARPCKSTIANLSLSYHFTMAGVFFLTYHLWLCDLSTSTELLELVFIMIPLLSHILIFIWAGYRVYNYIKTKRHLCRHRVLPQACSLPNVA